MWLQLVLTVLAGSSLAQAASTITDVRTAQQLEVAIKDGAEHIRIREHLDLRQLKLGPLCEDGGCAQLLLFKLADTTLSIQVRLHGFAFRSMYFHGGAYWLCASLGPCGSEQPCRLPGTAMHGGRTVCSLPMNGHVIA